MGIDVYGTAWIGCASAQLAAVLVNVTIPYEDLSCLLLMLKPIMPSTSNEIGTQLFEGMWSEVDFGLHDQ